MPRLSLACGRCQGPVGSVDLPDLGSMGEHVIKLVVRKSGATIPRGQTLQLDALPAQVMGNILHALCPLCCVEMGLWPSLSPPQPDGTHGK